MFQIDPSDYAMDDGLEEASLESRDQLWSH